MHGSSEAAWAPAGVATRGDTDRGIYVFTAVLFVATALAGFIPTSLGMLSAVEAGQRPPIPPRLHVHALATGSWLLMVLAQAGFAASGRRALHRRLGLASLLLAPTVAIAMIVLVAGNTADLRGVLSGQIPVPPPVVELVRQAVPAILNTLQAQIWAILLFATFYVWAISTRKRDTRTHRRMMLLATAAILTPATSRLVGTGLLPGGAWSGTHLTADLYALSLLLPAVISDCLRFGRPHRAWVIGIGLTATTMLVSHVLWNSGFWLATGSRLTGLPLP